MKEGIILWIYAFIPLIILVLCVLLTGLVIDSEKKYKIPNRVTIYITKMRQQLRTRGKEILKRNCI